MECGDVTLARILVVDDDRLVLATLSEGLNRTGYRATPAASGEDAIKFAAEQKFDLALVDMRMPGMSGSELTRRLREEFGICSVILSAYADLEFAREAAGHGALGYLVKPIEIANLVPAVEAALARSRELFQLRATQEQLNTALSQGRETSMAIGLLMERRRVDREAAFAWLRDAARARRCRVSEIAAEILRAAESLNSVGAPADERGFAEALPQPPAKPGRPPQKR